MRARIDGSWREITSGRVRVGNAWKDLASIRVFVGGAWREAKSFFAPFTALNITPDPNSNTRQTGAVRQTVASVATPTGGTPPFTYAWTRVSGDTGFTITSPSSSSTTFSRFISDEVTYAAVFQCVATDALGISRSDTVSVSITGVAFEGGSE